MNHKCIIGMHWELNPKEGAAWLKKWTTTETKFGTDPVEELTDYDENCSIENADRVRVKVLSFL